MLFIGILSLIAFAGQDIETATEERAQAGALAALEELVSRTGLPGLSVAVIEHGAIAWAAGIGTRSAGAEEPIDANTLFQAASISKPVAALATLVLADRGELDIDADVNSMLKRWQLKNEDDTAVSGVTPRHLMSHMAGLTVHGFPGYAAGAELPTAVQVLDGVSPSNTSAVRVKWPIGEKWRYSGGGFTILQVLLEDVSGRPFAALLDELVLNSLGMENSTYEQPLPETRHSNAATAHRTQRFKTGEAREHGDKGIQVAGRWHTYPERAAAGLWTTPTDLSRFLLAVRAASLGAEGAVLTQETAQAMLSPQFGSEWGIGPALFLHSEEVVAFGHGGSNHGFRCDARLDLRTGNGVVVMLHSGNGGPLNEARRIVAEHQGWVKNLTLSEEEADAYVGVYDLGERRMQVFVADGQLMARGNGPATELRPQGNHVFIPAASEYDRFTFKVTGGRAISLTHAGSGGTVTGPRK